VALIKKDGPHGFRIDIEADSTIAPDEQAEKASRTQFMREFVPFMQTMVPIAQGKPVEIAADVHAQHVDAATTVQSSNDKLQAVRETNATKLMIANQQQQAEREKLVSEQPFKSAELALEGARIKNQNDAESLRAATIAQRGAGNLQ
jgi:hypothetical protein